MENFPLARLQRLLDMLGPGLSLTVDRKAFKQFFGHAIDGPTGPAGIKIAKDFAKDCGCTFLFDVDRYEIRCGRTSVKSEDPS